MLSFASRTFAFAIIVTPLAVVPCGSKASADRRDFCKMTASALFAACKSQATTDDLVAKAICINVSDAADRDLCVQERQDARSEAVDLCTEQRDWRLEACTLLGKGRYDPSFNPAAFDDPKHPTNPNPFFPLTVGNRWDYSAGDEHDTVEIVDETKAIAGVHCIVARDQVTRNGIIAEDTDDWYVPAKDGTTWYCGEEVKDFETFAGDNPVRPELVSIDGSFKAGRNRDKPGIIFLASPAVGDVYLEEFSLANAEDVTRILSTTYAFGNDADLDHLVPQQLAQRFCSGDCVVTENFSLLEPGIVARKYYARDIGVFLEIELDTDNVIQLVDCNFDARCVNLPMP